MQEAGRDPKTLHEAQSRSDWPQWKAAMDREMDTLRKAGTWQTVLRPADKNVVDSKWVYHTKYKADGTVKKYKACMVTRGFTQVYGVDYMETYAPVAKLASLRTILALAARLGWRIDCFDFNAAYLNGELGDSEEIYMELPPGYGGGNAECIAKLDKALYGLKQARRIWYDTFACALAELGFYASAADPGVFYMRFGEHTLILIVHVDDCTLTGSCPELVAKYVTVVSTGTWGPRVRSDWGKSWEPAYRCTITCDCCCLVTFHCLLAGSITSSCSTWVIVRLHVLPS